MAIEQISILILVTQFNRLYFVRANRCRCLVSPQGSLGLIDVITIDLIMIWGQGPASRLRLLLLTSSLSQIRSPQHTIYENVSIQHSIRRPNTSSIRLLIRPQSLTYCSTNAPEESPGHKDRHCQEKTLYIYLIQATIVFTVISTLGA